MNIGSRVAAIVLLVCVGSAAAQDARPPGATVTAEPETLGPLWQYDTGG